MIENKKPLILITNDDGHHALGINSLVESVREMGEIVVVAPDGPRSGMSTALTVNDPLRIKLISQEDGVTWYACSGTPADCVKLALCQILDRRPDLLLSGINHGSNAAINVIYSGTMGATFEGCIQGIPSIGFSLCSHSEHADFTESMRVVKSIAQSVLLHGLTNGVCLNVNIPAVERTNGIKVCRQVRSRWEHDFEKMETPHGRSVYWLTGHFLNLEPESTDTDEWALSNHYVSVVPCMIDHTAHAQVAALSSLLNQ